MITVECPGCGLTHAVVLTTKQAHAGRRVTQRVRVPIEDAYGTKRGWQWSESSAWQPAGTAALTVTREDTEDVYTWACSCGTALAHRQPAVEYVACRHAAGPSGYCRVHDRTTMPPDDLYVNPRHGASCPCCGQMGGHFVRVDRVPDPAPLPACIH